MKRVLYVDFENVSSAGLNGVLKLTKNDEVKIFLGPKCSKMSLIEAESILHCDATVELIKNDQIGKNALDFIIMVHLGYDIAKREGDAFFIISNDKGYEPAIHEMQSKTGETIERYPDIEHVIARNDEEVGFFARLFKKKPVIVENTTEHEVLKKGNRTGSGRSGANSGRNNGARSGANGRAGNGAGSGAGRSTGGRTGASGSRSVRNGAGWNGSRNDRGVANGTGTQNGSGARNSGNGRNGAGNPQNGEQNNEKANFPEKKQQAAVEVKPAAQANNTSAPVGKPAEQAKKPSVTAVQKPAEQAKKPAAPAGAKPKAIVKASTKPGTPITITTQDDSYLDNLSIADLRAQLNVANTPIAPGEPAHAPRAKLEMSDAEHALVERALAETDNLGDFHNYILKELHDNDRATEIYKAEKHKVGKK